MKKFLSLAVIVGISFLTIAQTPTDFDWALSEGGTGTDAGLDLATDTFGNVYVTGFFKDTVNFGATTIISNGSHDVFIAKYDTNGNFAWVVNFGSANTDDGLGVATDNSGNVYVTGGYYNSMVVGATTLTSAGSRDMFLVKLDQNGSVVWAVSAGAPGGDFGTDLAVNSQGEIFASGLYNGAIDFGSGVTLASIGQNDAFIVKYNSDGTAAWAQSGGGTAGDEAHSIAIDGQGNLYIAGYFASTATFGTQSLSSSGQFDIFLAKYDAAGNFVWAVKGGGASFDYSFGVTADNNGNSYITGYYESASISFGSITIPNNGNWDIFVAKHDPDGNPVWAKNYGDAGWDYGYSINADVAGNVLVTGGFGATGGSVNFGSFSLANTQGGEDLFVVKMDSTGTELWAMAANSSDYVWGEDVTTDHLGNVYVTGSFEATTDFGNNQLISVGGDESFGEDIFLTRIDQYYNLTSDTTDTTGIGIIDIDFSSLILYPNPTHGEIRLKALNKGTKIEKVVIYNILGEATRIESISQNCAAGCVHKIDLSRYAKGIYFIEITTGSQTYKSKIIVQ